MYTNNRDAYRQAFYTAWEKHLQGKPLEPVEMQLVDAILLHPEYQRLFNQYDLQHQEFTLEENPFFHLSLHVAIVEQIRMDRPKGILALYHVAKLRFPDEHVLLHRMMAAMSEMLAEGTRRGSMPLDEEYITLLNKELLTFP